MKESPIPDHPLKLDLEGQVLYMQPKRFASGSVGWYLSGKVELSGSKSQLSFSAVVVGSKPKTLFDSVPTSDTTVSIGGVELIVDQPAPKPTKGKRPPKASEAG